MINVQTLLKNRAGSLALNGCRSSKTKVVWNEKKDEDSTLRVFHDEETKKSIVVGPQNDSKCSPKLSETRQHNSVGYDVEIISFWWKRRKERIDFKKLWCNMIDNFFQKRGSLIPLFPRYDLNPRHVIILLIMNDFVQKTKYDGQWQWQWQWWKMIGNDVTLIVRASLCLRLRERATNEDGKKG